MAFQVQGTGNWAPAFGSTTHALTAVSVVHAGNYAGLPGTIGRNEAYSWRVDRQRPPQGMANIQIQKDGVGAPSSVACVLVPTALSDMIPAAGDAERAQLRTARFSELTRAIHRGLNESVRSHRVNPQDASRHQIEVYEVSGSFSTA